MALLISLVEYDSRDKMMSQWKKKRENMIKIVNFTKTEQYKIEYPSTISFDPLFLRKTECKAINICEYRKFHRQIYL